VGLEPLRKQNGDDIPVFKQDEEVEDAEIPACRAAVSNRRLILRASCLFSYLLLRFAISTSAAKQTPHRHALITIYSTQNIR
jgi:hypothetical protein